MKLIGPAAVRDVLSSLSRRQKSMIFLGLDVALVPLSLLFALWVAPLPPTTMVGPLASTVAIPYLVIFSGIVFFSLGTHSRQLTEYDAAAFGRVAAAAVVITGGAAVLGMMTGVILPPTMLLMFGMAVFMCIAISRIILLQIVLAIYRRGTNVCRVLIYGAGTTGTQLVQAVRAHHSIEPIAFVDDNSALQGMTVHGLPVLPPVRIPDIVREMRIHRVLLAVPSLSPPKQARLARRLQKMGLEVQTLPSFSQLIGTEALIDKLEMVSAEMFLGRDEVQTSLDQETDTYGGRSVMVSGAGGSIGSELCRQLIATRPRRLVLFEMSEFALFTVENELSSLARDAGVEIVPVLGSVGDAERVRQVLAREDVEVIVHAAAYKHVRLVEQNPLAGLANNVLGTQVLASESARAGVERFILISSDKAVRPKGVMGASKRLAELTVQDLASRVPEGEGPVFAMVRFGNVLGSSGSVVPIFDDQIRRGGPVTVTHPDVTRYFMTIQEAVRLVLRAGTMAKGGEVYLLDMGQPVRIRDLAAKAIEAKGYTVRNAENPQGDIEIAYVGLRKGEKLVEELFLDGSQEPTDHRKIYRVEEKVLSEIETADVIRSLRRAIEEGDREAALQAVARRLHSFREERERTLAVGES